MTCFTAIRKIYFWKVYNERIYVAKTIQIRFAQRWYVMRCQVRLNDLPTQAARGQFHQRSTRSFYICKFRAQLFCAYVLGLYFTGARLLAQKLHVLSWWNWLSSVKWSANTSSWKVKGAKLDCDNFERLSGELNMYFNLWVYLWVIT